MTCTGVTHYGVVHGGTHIGCTFRPDSRPLAPLPETPRPERIAPVRYSDAARAQIEQQKPCDCHPDAMMLVIGGSIPVACRHGRGGIV